MPPIARRKSKRSPSTPRETPRATRPPRGPGRTVPASQREAEPERRKLVAFDPATWQALDLLAHDSMKDFQELADEAFRDLLKKHGRPTDLKTALRRSLGTRNPPGKAPD